MRKVITEIAVTVNGLEGPRVGFGWLGFHEEAAHAEEFLTGIDTIFYGRIAYEKYGLPRAVDQATPDEQSEFNDTLNNMRKFVFSRTVKHVAGSGMVINSNLPEEVNRIKDEEGKDIWLCGGHHIIRSFAELDLIDEYVLAMPRGILHPGRPIFAPVTEKTNLRLIRTTRLPSGLNILHYEPQRTAKNQLFYGRSI